MNPISRRVVLEVLERHLGPVAPVRWVWRTVAFGPCQRCYWPSHTLGLDGRPFHPFCWRNQTPPSGFDQWLLQKVWEEERGGS
jgi:hypothetical protein